MLLLGFLKNSFETISVTSPVTTNWKISWPRTQFLYVQLEMVFDSSNDVIIIHNNVCQGIALAERKGFLH